MRRKPLTFFIQGYRCLFKESSNTTSSFTLNTRTLNFLKDGVCARSSLIVVDNAPDLFLQITNKRAYEERCRNLKTVLAEKLNLYIGDIHILSCDNITSFDYLPCPGMIDKGLELLGSKNDSISGVYSTESMRLALEQRNIEYIDIKEVETIYSDIVVREAPPRIDSYPSDLQSILSRTENSSSISSDRRMIQDVQNYINLEQQAIQGDNFVMLNQ